jgi:hypothetical protein
MRDAVFCLFSPYNNKHGKEKIAGCEEMYCIGGARQQEKRTHRMGSLQ